MIKLHVAKRVDEGHCNTCTARENAKNSDSRIYIMKLGSFTIRLCKDCLRKLDVVMRTFV